MSVTGDPGIKPFDPLLHDIDLPLRARCYPMGFQAVVATNSAEVLRSAEESWGCYGPVIDHPPVEVRVIVESRGNLASEPVFRGQGSIYSIVSDSGNFAFFDAREMFGACFVTERTAADHPWFRWHFLEPLVYMLLSQHYIMPLHAASIARNGRGLLLYGGSGSGKSTLSYYCARAGWTYLADDSVWLLLDQPGCGIVGKPHQARFRDDAPRLFPELKGFAARPRPNGKLSIEVPTAAFPNIRTQLRSHLDCLVLLDRKSGARAAAEAMPGCEAVDRLAADTPSYGEEVNAMCARALAPLAVLPCYRLLYDRLEDAELVLRGLAERA